MDWSDSLAQLFARQFRVQRKIRRVWVRERPINICHGKGNPSHPQQFWTDIQWTTCSNEDLGLGEENLPQPKDCGSKRRVQNIGLVLDGADVDQNESSSRAKQIHGAPIIGKEVDCAGNSYHWKREQQGLDKPCAQEPLVGVRIALR